jgi:pimeloyl-ACP methyl ester carboxylesterase
VLIESTSSAGPVRINYASAGASGPPLLLLHGLSFRWQSFLPLIPSLAERQRVFAPDLRGHGGSGRADGDYEFGRFVDDVVNFVGGVIREPAAVFGHSLGGAVALAAAARLGDAVTHVIIGDNCVYRESQLALVRDSHLPALFAAVRQLAREAGSAAQAASALAELRMNVGGQELRFGDLPGNDAAFLQEWGEAIVRLDPEALDVLLSERHSESYDADAYLKNLSSKLMLLQADPTLGGVMPDGDVRRALEAAPAVRHIRLEGLGHALHMHQPSLVLKALDGFLGTA